MRDVALEPGRVVWLELPASRGREQSGRRPAVVVSSTDHLAIVGTLLIIVPVTSTDRGWPNHVELTGPTGLSTASFAMTEQPRTVSRQRIVDLAGQVDAQCLDEIALWLEDWIIRRGPATP